MNTHLLKNSIHRAIRGLGFDVVRYPPPDFDEAVLETMRIVQPFTLTSAERIHALCAAARYVSRHEIKGSVVECGVWRGGSMMAAARTLLGAGDTSRELWLYDTFEGMVAPGEHDRFINGQTAVEILAREQISDSSVPWCRAGLDEVRAAMRSVDYPEELLRFVKGPVEETIPNEVPEDIAILRLDTDWYESTRHELVHLFPLLTPGGVLIIDDYGAWEGARRAVDEFIEETNTPLLLCRSDASGRVAVVPARNGDPGRAD